jgi:transcriptional regulator with XRE-family HTH domain
MNRVKKFGSTVRRRRLARGFTQEQLAELANLHVNSISFIERGLVPPALDTICLIADALGLKVSDLVDDMERSADRSSPLHES